MKILATLIILGLCANVAFSTLGVSSAQAMAANALNTTAVRVYSAANSTDAAVWNDGTASVTISQVDYDNVWFGPGADNTTSYVWAIVEDSGNNALKKFIRRSLNNTIIAWGNDTTSGSYVTATDNSITTTAPATAGTKYTTAVGPNYFAVLSIGSDGTNSQVYVNLVSGTTATQTKITSIAADITASGSGYCTTTTLGLGNIWYDKASGAFFYTFIKTVVTDTVAIANAACGGTSNTVNTIHIGGMYTNGTAYWTTPLSLATQTPANTPTYVMGGGDNWINATNIYVVYKDESASTPTIYVSKTTKASTTTSGGSFGALVADVAATASVAGKEFLPLGVWASNYTYGIAVRNKTETAAAAGTYTYTLGNYLNGTTTYTDSGLTFSSPVDIVGADGWPMTTGYTLVGVSSTASSGNVYVLASFYGNGTANGTQATLGTFKGSVSRYADTNGGMWIGWQDIDSANSGYTYAGWLARLQGQIYASTSANALTTILAFVALFLASIFAF